MNGNMALDTNAAIALLNGEERLIVKIRHQARVYLPLPVVGELLFGALNSQRAEANLARIRELFERSTILAMGAETASQYAQTRLALKRQGRPIPENDVWIAALCIQHQLPLITNDRHFERIEGLSLDLV